MIIKQGSINYMDGPPSLALYTGEQVADVRTVARDMAADGEWRPEEVRELLHRIADGDLHKAVAVLAFWSLATSRQIRSVERAYVAESKRLLIAEAESATANAAEGTNEADDDG